MNPKIYTRITTTCIIIAILSAILIDRSESFRLLFGGLGLLAGLTATMVYLLNQRILGNRESEVEEGKAIERVAKDELFRAESNPHDEIAEFFAVLESKSYKAHRLWRSYPEHLAFADEVVEIIDKLSSAEHSVTYEFVLGRDGTVTVRPVRVPSRFEKGYTGVSRRLYLVRSQSPRVA